MLREKEGVGRRWSGVRIVWRRGVENEEEYGAGCGEGKRVQEGCREGM
jgi:hypothetical protein